jgi:flagellar hook-associated protein 2
MAGIQASGVGSGLDISSLISQLVAAERAPLDARITRQQSSANTQISALGGLKSSMSYLRDAVAGLRTTTAFALRSATSSNKDVFTATATDEVPAGSYDVEVVSLATAQKLTSEPFVGGRTAVVGTGTLTVSFGDTSFDVAIDDQHDTLADIRDAINTAKGNTGVSASIINESGGSRLVLTARDTGVENAVKVAQAGGDGGLSALVFDPANPGANTFTETAATDSHVRVNGHDYIGPSNSVTGAVDGLTLNLLKAAAGTEYTVTIANDVSATAAKIKKFVTDFNSLGRVLGNLQSYDATTGKAGAMLGDAYVRGLHADMRRTISDPVTGGTGDFTTLAALGITTDATGQLVVNDTKLNAALAADFDGIASMFSATDGIATRIHAKLDAALKSDAQLATRTDSLNDQLKRLSKEQDAIDSRMEAVQARYLKQFTALDTLLTQMQSTSSFLAQQLGASSSGS